MGEILDTFSLQIGVRLVKSRLRSINKFETAPFSRQINPEFPTMSTNPNEPEAPQPTGNVKNTYWRSNLRILSVLLLIWFLVSFGCGILFVDELNQIRMGGFKLGFWFAQQGSIYVFLILIAIYVFLMNRLDHKHGVFED